MSSAFFISDVHLDSVESDHGKALIEIVKRAQIEASLFVILGDLFDLWVGPGLAFQKKYAQLINEMKTLRKTCHILYIEGNHDFHLKDFWEAEVGCEVCAGPTRFQFGGLNIRAEHGDQANKDDRGYLFLRRFLRTSPMRLLIKSIPSSIVSGVGSLASKTSRRFSHRSRHDIKRNNQIKTIVRSYALEQRNEEVFDLLILGHTHVADDFLIKSENGQGRLINLGSWYEGARYLIINQNGESRYESINDGSNLFR